MSAGSLGTPARPLADLPVTTALYANPPQQQGQSHSSVFDVFDLAEVGLDVLLELLFEAAGSVLELLVSIAFD